MMYTVLDGCGVGEGAKSIAPLRPIGVYHRRCPVAEKSPVNWQQQTDSIIVVISVRDAFWETCREFSPHDMTNLQNAPYD